MLINYFIRRMQVTLTSRYPLASNWQQLAENALTEWEHNRPSSPASIAPAAGEHLIAGIGELLGKSGPTNLDLEDVRHILRQASPAVACCVDAAGPNRASQAIAELIAQLTDQGFHCALTTGRLLLRIISHTDAALAMDELTLILEALQQHLGSEWELTFGHGDETELPVELRVALLVAAGTESRYP